MGIFEIWSEIGSLSVYLAKFWTMVLVEEYEYLVEISEDNFGLVNRFKKVEPNANPWATQERIILRYVV